MVMYIRSNSMNIPVAIPKRVSRCLLSQDALPEPGNSLKHARTLYAGGTLHPGIDRYMDLWFIAKPILGKVRRYDGYTVQNICIETLPWRACLRFHLYASQEGQASVDYLS